MKQFNVIIFRHNVEREFKPYDVLPYFRECWSLLKPEERPKSKEEFKRFVKKEAQYHYWARAEYEIILRDWPTESYVEKWDIYQQILMNLDIIVDILWEEITGK